MTEPTPPDVTPPGPGPKPRQRSRKGLVLRLGAVLVVFAVAAGWLKESGIIELLADRQGLQTRVDDLGVLAVLAYLGIWIMMQVLLSQALLPTIAGGMMFGWLGGGLLAVVGASLGCTVQFLVARYVFRSTAEWLVLERFPGVREQVAERGTSLLFFLRLIYAPSFVLNIVAGVSPIKLRQFAMAFPAMIPHSILICFVTDSFYRYGWADMPPIRWATMVGIVVAATGTYLWATRRWPELKIKRRGE